MVMRRGGIRVAVAGALALATLLAAGSDAAKAKENHGMADTTATAVATFGGGCFWCMDAIFREMKGVGLVESGFSGGAKADPTYEEVCGGDTGHAEVIQVHYDPSQVTYDELLEVFWKTHDPTTLNRQGNDVGTQYRSVIFWHDEAQHKAAVHYRKALDAEKIWPKPIVTEIVPFKAFYRADDHHQDYYEQNPGAGYCLFVIRPKVEKFRKVFKSKLKTR